MLVPRTRLLLWVSLIVLPFAAAGATVPGAMVVACTFIGALLLLALGDAVMAHGRLAGIRVSLPELVRLQKDRAGVLEVRIENPSMVPRALRVGFAFPHEIMTSADDRTALLPGGAEFSRLDWTVTPARRGQYFLDRAYMETASPLGFWAARTSQSARSELRVYPNLFQERKHVAALFLRRGQFGTHAQRQAGQGRDFEKLREYVHGDSYDEIHWKASAKRGHPVTKVFQVERTQEVYVIVDASRLSAREVKIEEDTAGGKRSPRRTRGLEPLGSLGALSLSKRRVETAAASAASSTTTALERCVTAALILGLAAEQQGDQFGVLTFSDRVISFVRAKSGQAHYDACRDRLYTLQPQDVSPDFDEVCSFIRLRLRRRALLIFLTALDDPMLAESFVHATELISRQHLILADMLQPAGARPLFDDAGIKSTEEIYRRLGGHFQWHSLRELQKVLQRRGVRLSLLDPDKLTAQLIAQHADIKRRQLI